MSDSQDTTIVIIGSGALRPSDDVYRKIVAALTFHQGEIRIRRPDTSPIEGWIWENLADDRIVVPYPSPPGKNNYDRDHLIVQGADLVMSFFPEERFMEGGTGHVVECAIEADVPVEAWAMHPDGSLTLFAEHDGVWTAAARTWQSSRLAASLAISNYSRLMSMPFKPSPSRSVRHTTTGSGNTRTTGKGKSRTGSIFQVRSGSAPLPPSARNSSGT